MDKRENNRIINDIMSNSSPVTILLSSSDGENIDFVSDLSNCYKNTFWLNCEYDNMYSFTISLAKKVFSDDEDMIRKLMQFKYCVLDYNEDNIILNVALQKISTLEGDCLLVLDNLELLPIAFNNEIIELLINNCPKNLKILLISEKFLDLNYNLFEPNCPKLIDEMVLEKNNQTDFSVIEQLGLSNEDLAFLSYVSQLRHFDREFVNTIYDKGNEILSMLSIKYKNIVFCKGKDLFWINCNLHDYLLEKYPDFENYDIFTENINLIIYNYFLLNCKHVKAIKLAYINKWYDLADKAIELLINDELCGFMLVDFAKNITTNILHQYNVEKYFNCKILLSIVELNAGNIQVAKNLYDELLSQSKPKTLTTYNLYYLKCLCLAKEGNSMEAAMLCSKVINDATKGDNFENVNLLQCLLGYLPSLYRNTNMVLEISELKKYDKMLCGGDYENSHWYPKIVQTLAESYFDLGYYTKAIDKVEKLKEIFPFYMLPHKLIDYYYFSGDIEMYVNAAKLCLENSQIYNIDSDLASVYTLLARGSAYCQKYDEALCYMDLAVKCNNSSEQVKYNAIATRALMYARMGKIEYAKDIALIYAKICELNNSKFTYFFYAVLSFCFWSQKDLNGTKKYANMCLLSASAKSGIWFLASSLSLSCIIMKGEIRDAKTLLNKFFSSCKLFSMEPFIVDYYSCFETPLERAKEEGIMLDFLKKIDMMLEEKKNSIAVTNKVYIKFFGNTSVIVNNEQVVWKTKKSKELFLLYIWAGEDGIDRKKIIDLLWKDYVYVSSLNNLKTTNNIIRKTLHALNVTFKLEYKNSNYTLYLPDCESDYDNLIKTRKDYRDDLSVKERAEILTKTFMNYDYGFAMDIYNDEFNETRRHLQSEIVIKSLKLIGDLIAVGEYLEAKRFLNNLERINGVKEDYSNLQIEIDNNIRKRF